MSVIAGIHDIVIDQGARWSLAVTWQDYQETPINITNFLIAGQVRTNYAAKNGTLLAEMEAVILEAAEGLFELSISSAVTATMPAGTWRWDVELAPASYPGEVQRLLMGKALVRGEVTR